MVSSWLSREQFEDVLISPYLVVLGIYFHLSTEPQHPATKDWNVKLFKVRTSNLTLSI
jgi:hypothetical protein